MRPTHEEPQMNGDAPDRTQEIFAEAMQVPPDRRAAFLDRVCARDPALSWPKTRALRPCVSQGDQADAEGGRRQVQPPLRFRRRHGDDVHDRRK